jgi:exodeoxyribonuclease V alpha subunit
MGTLVYSPEMHRFEERAAAALAERAAAVSSLAPLGNGDPRAFYESAAQEAMRSLDIDLTDKQLNGVVSALVCPVSVITGLPGTGKTTSLRVLVKALQIAGVRTSDPDKGPSHDSGCLLMAPTGIAAKRITHVTGAGASTIHRALGGTPGSVARRESVYEGVLGEAAGSRPGSGDSVWSYGAGNTHPARIVVVDEASMLDAELLWRVLDGTRPDAHVVFVGDAAQLPSVGPGNVMRDLVSCGTFPTTDLREIFRQEEASDIVVAAHAIHGGEDPPLGGDFRLLLCRDEAAALEVVKRVVQRLYDGRANFQVLSPRHGGTAGVTNLNSDLRDMINPSGAGSREIRIASGYVREGDRVMVVQNDYDLGVYNGDVGKVTGIDLKRKRIEVKIHGPSPYRISTDIKTAARLLRLAYAQTVHKSQGQEYDVIVLPILDSHGVQLQRNLFYTAVTRAKKKVILVGQESALRRAIANDKQAGRYTALAQRIHAATEQGGPPSHRSRKGEEGETPDTGRTE